MITESDLDSFRSAVETLISLRRKLWETLAEREKAALKLGTHAGHAVAAKTVRDEPRFQAHAEFSRKILAQLQTPSLSRREENLLFLGRHLALLEETIFLGDEREARAQALAVASLARG